MKGGVYGLYNEITQLIATVGFPCAMCVAMGFFVKYITDKHREELTKLNTQHYDEVKNITDAINNNTLALQHLCDTLGK